jgi:hypothetical protein
LYIFVTAYAEYFPRLSAKHTFMPSERTNTVKIIFYLILGTRWVCFELEGFFLFCLCTRAFRFLLFRENYFSYPSSLLIKHNKQRTPTHPNIVLYVTNICCLKFRDVLYSDTIYNCCALYFSLFILHDVSEKYLNCEE